VHGPGVFQGLLLPRVGQGYIVEAKVFGLNDYECRAALVLLPPVVYLGPEGGTTKQDLGFSVYEVHGGLAS